MANKIPASPSSSIDVKIVPDWLIEPNTAYQRVGNDLLILRADGFKIFLQNYFTHKTLPQLITLSGQAIPQETIDLSLAEADIALSENNLDPAAKLEQALATGENIDDVLSEILPVANPTQKSINIFLESFQSAMLEGERPNSALKIAIDVFLSNIYSQAQSPPIPNSHSHFLTALASGEEIDSALNIFLKGMSPEQASQFSDILTHNLAKGISIEETLKEANAAIKSMQKASIDTDTPPNPNSNLLNALATGENVESVLSQYNLNENTNAAEAFQNTLIQALSSNTSVTEALAQAQESKSINTLEAALSLGTDFSLITALASGENITQAITSLVKNMNASSEKTSLLTQNIQQVLGELLAQGGDLNEAISLAQQTAMTAISTQEQTASSESGSNESLLFSLASGENISNALSKASTDNSNMIESESMATVFQESLIKALNQGVDTNEAFTQAQETTQLAQEQAVLLEAINTEIPLMSALASGIGIEDMIESIIPSDSSPESIEIFKETFVNALEQGSSPTVALAQAQQYAEVIAQVIAQVDVPLSNTSLTSFEPYTNETTNIITVASNTQNETNFADSYADAEIKKENLNFQPEFEPFSVPVDNASIAPLTTDTEPQLEAEQIAKLDEEAELEAQLQSESLLQAEVTPVTLNNAPTLSSFATVVASVNEDTEIELTFAALAAQGNEADIDGSVGAFVIQAVSSGTLNVGTSAGTATAYVAGTNDVIDSTHNAYWTPATNVSGTLNAFTVIAKDNEGLESATAIQTQVAVTPVNDAPTLTSFSTLASINEGEVQITHSTLLARGNEADIDGSVTGFVVKSVSSGALKIGTSSALATAWNASSNNLIDGTRQAYFSSPANSTGTLNAFTVTAKDDSGLESVTAVQTQITVASVFEANNTGTSSSVSAGSSSTGNIHITGDNDWFGVLLQGGIQYNVEQKGSPTGSGTLGDPQILGIYDGSGLLVSGGDDDSGVGLNAQLYFTPSFTAGYYIETAGYNSGYIGTYTISVSTGADPIIIDLGSPKITLTNLENGVNFDFDTNGSLDKMGWTTGEDGILVHDVDKSGFIENGSEIFSPFYNFSQFDNSLAALKSIDSNQDNLINTDDVLYQDLQVWVDSNTNGISEQGELKSLSELGIQSFDLNALKTNYEIAGQKVISEGTVNFTDGSTTQFAEVVFDLEINLDNESFTSDQSATNKNINNEETVERIMVESSTEPTFKELILGAENSDNESFEPTIITEESPLLLVENELINESFEIDTFQLPPLEENPLTYGEVI